jgi:hypothetical protein
MSETRARVFEGRALIGTALGDDAIVLRQSLLNNRSRRLRGCAGVAKTSQCDDKKCPWTSPSCSVREVRLGVALPMLVTRVNANCSLCSPSIRR